jgi:hypothetical protein
LTLCIVDIRGNVKYPKKNPNSDFIALNHLSIGIHLLIAILFSLSSSATKKNEVQFVGNSALNTYIFLNCSAPKIKIGIKPLQNGRNVKTCLVLL